VIPAGIGLAADGEVIITGKSSGTISSMKMASDKLADYAAGTADWSAGTTTFGACLRAVSAGAATDVSTWSATGSCTTVNADPWHPVVTTSADPNAKVAKVVGPGVINARADLRFGSRTTSSQAPGTYVAPIVLEVDAPNI
jgi:hypothetical protein